MAGVKHESKEIVEKKEGISVSKTKVEEMFQYKTDPLEIVQVKMEPEVQLEEFEGNNELPIDCVLEEDPDATCTEDEETLDIPGTSKAQMEDSKVRANLNTENDESDSAGNNETFAKQFYCGYCEYGTSHKGNLIKHLRIHTGEKPFNCKYCDFKCTRKYGLILHEQRHTGKESFTCHYCHYRCTRKDHLITHIRSHTGEKPFKCSICGFECSRKYHLVTHSRIHTGEKPFKCAHCDYATARKDNLGCHIRKKHKEATD